MLHIIDHPLIQYKLTIMRKKDTSCAKFRNLLEEVTAMMIYEVTRNLPTVPVDVETPVGICHGSYVNTDNITIVPILRAGLGFLQGTLGMIPDAHVGVIGLYRDEETLKPIEYYCKLPRNKEAEVIVVDPMLATGGSAAAAVTMLKKKGLKNIRLMVLVAAPPGVELMKREHPDVEIYTAALDEKLNEHGYIVPGLGDAGDRIFGTL